MRVSNAPTIAARAVTGKPGATANHVHRTWRRQRDHQHVVSERDAGSPTGDQRASRSTDVVRACDLLAEELAPIRMIVEPYIPAGLFLVAGDPKAGKTLLMQDLALSITRGEPAWGGLHVDQGSALYLANEGGQRSFRDRLVKMLELDTDDATIQTPA